MNSENAQKDIAQSFIDFVDMAKGLMDKNQQPFVPHELGRLPSTRGRGGRDESRELLRVGAGESSAAAADTNNTSFATVYHKTDN